MSFLLEFNIGVTQSCSDLGAAEMKIQMATQTLPARSETGGVYDGGGLAASFAAISWANPTVLTAPFEFNEVRSDGAFEAGLVGTDEMSLECDNYVIGTVSNTKVRMFDVLSGQHSVLTFDPDSEICHVRMLHKKRGASVYTVRYWGVLDMSSFEAIMGDTTDPDTWKVKVKVADTLSILEKYDMVTFVDEVLSMANAYTSTGKYMTFIGDLEWDSVLYEKGRYSLLNIKWDDGSRVDWLGNRTNPPVLDGFTAVAPIRYHRITDIIASVSTFLGLEGAVNNGTAWSDVCKWKFYYNDAQFGATQALVSRNIDELFIVSGFYLYDGTQNVYAHRGTFFDRDGAAPHSFMSKNNPLEMLKDICISFGLKCRIAVNSAGQRYLDVRSVDKGDADIAWGADSQWYSDVRITPFSRRINGVEIVSGQSNITRGASGNESVKINSCFTVANHIRGELDFRKFVRDVGGGEVGTVVGETPAYAFWSALWAMATPLTGSNYTGAYTICAIQPGMAGNAAGETYGGNYPYIGNAQVAGQPMDYGMIVGNYSGIDFTDSSTYSNVVLYPNDIAPVNSWAEVPAMALAHYYYSPRRIDLDHVGVYRSKGMEIEITRAELIGTYVPIPGTLVTVVLNGVSYVCRIVNVSENLLENTTKFTLEYWGV